jgi:Protein of unknown function (DUF3156)
VRLRGIEFGSARGDHEGSLLAERLTNDPRLARALADVHFEQIRVEPDGRPTIRHMGGSVVWALSPPLVWPVLLVDEQARATADALAAFVAVGR